MYVTGSYCGCMFLCPTKYTCGNQHFPVCRCVLARVLRQTAVCGWLAVVCVKGGFDQSHKVSEKKEEKEK